MTIQRTRQTRAPGVKRQPGEHTRLTDTGGVASAERVAIPPRRVLVLPRASDFVMAQNVATSTSNEPAVRANPARRHLSVQNRSPSVTVLVSTQGPAHSSPALRLRPGETWEPFAPPGNDIFVAVAVGDGDAEYLITEG